MMIIKIMRMKISMKIMKITKAIMKMKRKKKEKIIT